MSGNAGRLVTAAWSASLRGPIRIDIHDHGARAARSLFTRENSRSAATIALRPDGRELALGGSIQEVWDLETGEPRFRLHGESTFTIGLIAYSPDGRKLAIAESFFLGEPGNFSAGIGHRVVLYDASTGIEEGRLEDEDVLISHLAFSADGRSLVGVGGRRFHRWDAESHKKVQSLNLNAPALMSSLTPDLTRLASVDREGRVSLWDTGSGQRLVVFPGLTGESTSITFDPSGRRLILGGIDAEGARVKIFDATPVD
jgi:WD40 repeat protein